MVENIPGQENQAEFGALVEKLGGEKEVRGVASRIGTSTMRGESPDVSEIERLKALLEERLRSLTSEKKDAAEWHKLQVEHAQIAVFLDGIAYGLRVAEQRIRDKG
jgi:hypothetical protein